jgi:hypothetical protein
MRGRVGIQVHGQTDYQTSALWIPFFHLKQSVGYETIGGIRKGAKQWIGALSLVEHAHDNDNKRDAHDNDCKSAQHEILQKQNKKQIIKHTEKSLII